MKWEILVSYHGARGTTEFDPKTVFASIFWMWITTTGTKLCTDVTSSFESQHLLKEQGTIFKPH